MYNFYILLRLILYPVMRYLVPFFSAKAKDRVYFELNNRVKISALRRANFGFEISSEGELEQVKVIVEHLLDLGETVEIIYCSDSVERQCLDIATKYPEQVRLLRLPILCFNPLSSLNNPVSWLTCHTFFMCRYDFFPELIHYGKKKNVNFVLVSAAIKNFSSKNFLEKIYLKNTYRSFNKIITVSESMKTELLGYFELNSSKIETFDFRLVQIKNRLSRAQKSICDRYHFLQPLISHLNETKGDRSTIFGSFWNNEFLLLKDTLKDFVKNQSMVCIVPHKLGQESLKELTDLIKNLDVKYFEVNASSSIEDIQNMLASHKIKPGVWILNLKGILCELYSFFPSCYVGGGYGVSVHSVLEPFLTGATVYCGPKVQRSSEFDMASEIDRSKIFSITDMTQVISFILQNQEKSLLGDQSDHIEAYIQKYPLMLEWLNLDVQK